MKKVFIFLAFLLLIGCDYPHDNKILIDVDGNLYQLHEATVNNTYYVVMIPADEVDSLFLQK